VPALVESQGVEQVREQLKAVLAKGVGPRGSIAIWTESSVTVGFYQEWLSWHDRRRANREDVHRRQSNLLAVDRGGATHRHRLARDVKVIQTGKTGTSLIMDSDVVRRETGAKTTTT
jgi:hypothetical protein